MFDLIIIGGGPAGISAGIYAVRKKLKTLILTKDFVGQIGKAFNIENYPGFIKIRGIELVQKLKDHIQKFEIEIEEGAKATHVEKDNGGFLVQTENGEKYRAKALLVATGRDPRPLEVPGEKEFLGKGVGYCVTCDGPLFADKKTAVVGGGNSGLESALELSDYCSQVYVLELHDKLLADEIFQERAKKKHNIEIVLNARTKEIKGIGNVKSIIYEDLKTKKEKEIEVEGVFIEIGYIPATSFLKGLVDFNEQDEVIIDLQTNQTKTPGIFAAGDVTNVKQKQIIIAAGEGAKAALSIYDYLKKLSA